MSGNELEKKEIEDLKVYLMRQVFIVKADCANWKYLEALTDEIIHRIEVAAQAQINAKIATKNAMIKCIKRRSVLCDLIAIVEQDKEWIVNIESSKIDFTPHDPTDRNFEIEEHIICPEVRRDSLQISFICFQKKKSAQSRPTPKILPLNARAPASVAGCPQQLNIIRY